MRDGTRMNTDSLRENADKSGFFVSRRFGRSSGFNFDLAINKSARICLNLLNLLEIIYANL